MVNITTHKLIVQAIKLENMQTTKMSTKSWKNLDKNYF